jgi:antirestriction protein ArdC
MMCSGISGIKLGDDHIQQHSAYLASWMQALKDDKNAIFKAAAAAQKTCDYLDQLVAPTVTPVAVEPAQAVANEPSMQPAVVRRKSGPR